MPGADEKSQPAHVRPDWKPKPKPFGSEMTLQPGQDLGRVSVSTFAYR